MDLLAEPENFVWGQESRCSPAEMELHDVALAIQDRAHLIELLRDIVQVNAALALVLRNDRIATAVPAERLAERNVKVEREIARFCVIRDEFFGELRPGDLVRELRRGWVGGITR